MAKQVFSKQERHEQGVAVGIKLAKKVGLARVSIGKVAAQLKVTAPLLFHVFGNRDGFHKAVAKAAKAQGVVFPDAEPTVRAARAARVGERDKTVKALKKGGKPKVVAPKKAAVKVVAPKKGGKPKVVAPKAAAKVVKPAAKAPKVAAPKKAAVKRVRKPKAVVPPELAKFPMPVAPVIPAVVAP